MRKLLLTLLLLTAVVGILVNVWYQVGYYPYATQGFVERAYDVFGYARFLAVPVAVFAFLYQRGQPTKTLAWIAIMLGLPFLGTVVYLFFGLNMRQDIKFRRKRRRDRAQLEDYTAEVDDGNGDRLMQRLIDERGSKALALQRTLLCNTTGTPPTSAYGYCVFHDGDALFDQIAEDLEAARHHIHLEYFHFEDDWLGERLADILRRKARAGVEVRVIYDAVGSRKAARSFWRKLERAGAQVSPFFAVRFRHLANRINYRNHRKIVVVDGAIAYTGGFNVAKEYIEGVEEVEEIRDHWRDTHVRLRGAAVHHLQMVFACDWRFSQGERLGGDAYFPPLTAETRGTIPVQIAASGPDTDRNNIKYAYFNILTRAERYCYLVTPYFTPDGSVLAAMKTAALAGIDVRLMMPRRSDSLFVTLASNSYVDELLEAGVRVYHYTRGMLHSKVVVADDVVTSIGTANMDARSHDLNFEVNAILYDEAIAQEEREILECEMEAYCTELNPDNWPDPHLHIRLARGFARVFSPLL